MFCRVFRVPSRSLFASSRTVYSCRPMGLPSGPVPGPAGNVLPLMAAIMASELHSRKERRVMLMSSPDPTSFVGVFVAELTDRGPLIRSRRTQHCFDDAHRARAVSARRQSFVSFTAHRCVGIAHEGFERITPALRMPCG